MKILYAAAFDPAGVMTSHCKALRAAGHESYLGVERVFYSHPNVVRDTEFRGAPDVFVVCPGIGSGLDANCWAANTEVFAPEKGLDIPEWIVALLAKAPNAKKVALFHGSANTAAFTDRYAAWYRERGFALAATTFDYAVRLGAAYMPPIVDVGGRRAKPRLLDQDSPCEVVHAPTNPELCNTKDFLYAAVLAGARVTFLHGKKHEYVLNAKAQCHVGFDHMRGSFSVNTLENAAIGLVPLFRFAAEYEVRRSAEGISKPPIVLRTDEDLWNVLRLLVESPELTRALQSEARTWFVHNFSPMILTERLVRLYTELP